MGAILWASGRN